MPNSPIVSSSLMRPSATPIPKSAERRLLRTERTLTQLRRFEHFLGSKYLRSLESTPEGRHYSGIGDAGAPAVIFGDGWAGNSSLSFFSNRLSSGSGLGVAAEQQFTAVGGRQVHVDHLHGGKLLQHAARRQPRRQRVQAPRQRDMQAIGQEGNENVGLNARLALVKDRPDREIAFEVLERLLDRNQQQIMAPQLGGVFLDQVGAQQIAAFARSGLPQLFAIEAIAERSAVSGDLDHRQAPGDAGLIARGAEFHQQLLARRLHRRELLEPRPQPLQLAPPYRPLLGNTVAALGQDVELALLRQQLDLDAGSRLLPRLSDQMFFQTRQATLWRAHQIIHWRISRAHLGEHLLGRHAAVHQPDATRLAVLPLDAIEKPPQGRLVRGVAGQHLIGQRQTFGGHHQGNDDLHTIWPVIARVPEAPLVAFRKRRIRLEIGARQVIEQHVVADVEQVSPPPRQVIKDRLLVHQQPVVTAVQLVDLSQPCVLAQKIGQGTAPKPLAVQPPFAARRQQAIGDQHEQDLIPVRSFAARPQPLRPELIELQLTPQHQRQPARAPLPWPPQLQLRQLDVDDRGVRQHSCAAVFRKQRQRLRLRGAFLEHLD